MPCPMMRHSCPIVRHPTLPEIRRKIENRPGKSKRALGNSKNRPAIASPPPRRARASRLSLRSRCGKSPSARLGREPIFRAVARRRRRSWPESQGFCGSRPRSTCRRAAPEIPPAFSSLAPGARCGPRRRCPTWDIYVPSTNPILTRRTRAIPRDDLGDLCASAVSTLCC